MKGITVDRSYEPVREPVWWPLYDTAIIHAGHDRKAEISFFRSGFGEQRDNNPEFGKKDRLDTNMWISGALPQPQQFQMHGLLIVPDLRRVSNNATKRVVRDHVEQIRHTALVRLFIGCKYYVEIPATCVLANLILADDDMAKLEVVDETSEKASHAAMVKAAEAYDPRQIVPLDKAFRVYIEPDQIDLNDGKSTFFTTRNHGKRWPLYIPSLQSFCVSLFFPDGMAAYQDCPFGLKAYMTGILQREVQ